MAEALTEADPVTEQQDQPSSTGRRMNRTTEGAPDSRPNGWTDEDEAKREDLPRELGQLLSRLETILPVVRQQQREANRAAEVAYFTAKGEPHRLKKALILSGRELVEIDYQRVKTPEACELHSIGLAVAAFGGCDAVSEVGWMLADRGCRDFQFAWSRWDGMANHWL
jgi:hypothetical protein